MIPVTKPFTPPIEDYIQEIRGIWERNFFTNNGPLVNSLEIKLKDFLNLSHLLFLGNGTIALQIAIKALELKGEIITTPFSYVATTSSIVWEGCIPVFVDIDPLSLNIDVNKIESAITDRTSAILATHVYGNPCDVDAIQRVAQKYNLKIVYDAAHCFGTKYRGKSIFEFGDISTTSFHATKLFHTIEGGAVITNEPELLKKMTFLRNFGHNGPETFETVGINGKNSEFHAAMGLCNLRFIEQILNKRKEQSKLYDHYLDGLNVRKIKLLDEASFNYAYYPIIFENEAQLHKTINLLNSHEIFPRRYFFPSLHTLNYTSGGDVPIATDISKKVVCLPLYHTLHESEISMIGRLLKRAQNND